MRQASRRYFPKSATAPSAAVSRRDFCRVVALGSSALAAPLAAAATRRPNIVYVLADDLGWGDLDCYNPDSAVPTPFANRFAEQGVRFTDMHSPSSVCTPTRYGILSGRYCWRTRLKQGVLQGYSPSLIEPGRLTVPGMLQRRGYFTAGVGKWNNVYFQHPAVVARLTALLDRYKQQGYSRAMP